MFFNASTIKKIKLRKFLILFTLSDWIALMVKQDFLVEGKTVNGAPEIPFGVTKALVKEEARLVLSWLAMADAEVAIRRTEEEESL